MIIKKAKPLQTAMAVLLTWLTAPFDSATHAHHLSGKQCLDYFNCVLGQESALNLCYDNNHLKEIGTTRVMCMRIAQHQCKVVTGIQGTGRQMTISRPGNWYRRPTLLDQKEGVVALVEEDIRIYNYAGWNHCPIQYQGLQDFWCDPTQLRYPPEPWCDVLPTYNVQPNVPTNAKSLLHPLRRELLERIEGLSGD